MQLEFVVKQQHIVRTDKQRVVAGSKKYLFAHFHFSEDWIGIKTAIFKNHEIVCQQLVDESGICEVPYEVITEGKLEVSAFCGNLITADKVEVDIVATGYTEGSTPRNPSITVYEQIIKQLNNIQKEKINEETIALCVSDYFNLHPVDSFDEKKLQEYIDTYMSEHKEEYIGAPGIQGPKGDAGASGKTPQRGIDYMTSDDMEYFKDYIDNQLGAIIENSY